MRRIQHTSDPIETITPTMTSGMDRASAIRRSLATFVWGLFGWLPVLGLIPAVCALSHWWIVRSNFRDQWNPASAYLRAGMVFAGFGLLSTILLAAVIALAIVGSFL
jgi:hypothetical protein